MLPGFADVDREQRGRNGHRPHDHVGFLGGARYRLRAWRLQIGRSRFFRCDLRGAGLAEIEGFEPDRLGRSTRHRFGALRHEAACLLGAGGSRLRRRFRSRRGSLVAALEELGPTHDLPAIDSRVRTRL